MSGRRIDVKESSTVYRDIGSEAMVLGVREERKEGNLDASRSSIIPLGNLRHSTDLDLPKGQKSRNCTTVRPLIPDGVRIFRLRCGFDCRGWGRKAELTPGRVSSLLPPASLLLANLSLRPSLDAAFSKSGFQM